jgi:putative aldouronate transport system substrate-binding protein
MHGFFPIGDTKIPGVVKSGDDKLTVINQYETPEFKEYIQTMRKYYLAGYIKKDAATSEEYSNDDKAGKNVVNFPAYLVEDSQDRGGKTSLDASGAERITKRFTEAAVSTDRVLATMTAISSTSKNPERAMMLLELMYNDDKLYNTLVWGVEGKHYKVVEENNAELGKVVEGIPGSGYEMGIDMAWEFGNTSKAWLKATSDPHKFWVDANEKAITAPHLGFAFDAKDLSTESAQCSAVVSEFLLGLTTGSIDVDKYYPQFIDKLDKAGAKKIVAEKQKQIDAWKATK